MGNEATSEKKTVSMINRQPAPVRQAMAQRPAAGTGTGTPTLPSAAPASQRPPARPPRPAPTGAVGSSGSRAPQKPQPPIPTSQRPPAKPPRPAMPLPADAGSSGSRAPQKPQPPIPTSQRPPAKPPRPAMPLPADAGSSGSRAPRKPQPPLPTARSAGGAIGSNGSRAPQKPQPPLPARRPAPAPTPLGPEEQKRYLVHKASFLPQIAGKASRITLTATERSTPVSEKASVGKKVDTALDVGQMINEVAECGFFDQIMEAIGFVRKIGSYVKKVVGYIKDSEKGHTKDERFAFAMETLDAIMECIKGANSILELIVAAVGKLPIIGVVFGTIGAAMGFVVNAKNVFDATRSIGRMKADKSASKDIIRGRELAGSTSAGTVLPSTATKADREAAQTATSISQPLSRFEESDSSGSGEKPGKVKIQRNFGAVRDGIGPKAPMRKERLDEKLVKARTGQAGAAASPMDEKRLSALEDYEIAKELTGANQKRQREGILKLVFQDAMGFVAALATLDPSGIGSAVGSGITGIVAVGFLAKKAGGEVRQRARETGFGGADVNKSDKNKEQRRHNLSVMMFDRLQGLAKYDYENIPTTTTEEPKKEQVRAGLDPYDTMQNRITAMGVMGSLYRADTGRQMVDTMKKGFYREND